jgi:phage head maturation protease
MTTTTDTELPHVETDGDLVHMVIVKWGTATIAERAPSGDIVIYREHWDADSFERTTAARTRLLIAHDPAHAAGILTRIEPTTRGLEGWGHLVGSRSAKENVRAQIREGLTSEASVGFANSDADLWARATTRNGLPSVTRRGARVKEASLVWQGAVPGSRVLSVTRPASSPIENPALIEAEHAVRSGIGGRLRLDKQISDHAEQAEQRAILDEADRLIAAGERWRTSTTTITDTQPSAKVLSILSAQHQRHQNLSSWDERMRQLLDHRPTDQAGWDQWQRRHAALMDEKFPTRR